MNPHSQQADLASQSSHVVQPSFAEWHFNTMVSLSCRDPGPPLTCKRIWKAKRRCISFCALKCSIIATTKSRVRLYPLSSLPVTREALYVMHLLSIAASQDGCRLLFLPCGTIQGPSDLAGHLFHTLPAKVRGNHARRCHQALSKKSR